MSYYHTTIFLRAKKQNKNPTPLTNAKVKRIQNRHARQSSVNRDSKDEVGQHEQERVDNQPALGVSNRDVEGGTSLRMGAVERLVQAGVVAVQKI